MNQITLRKGNYLWTIQFLNGQYRTIRNNFVGKWIPGSEKKVQSLIREKIKNGYSENGTQDYFIAMSAKNIKNTNPKFPCVVEYKLDGVRLEVTENGIFTTNNQSKTLSRKLEHLPHLERELMFLRKIVAFYLKREDFVLEGELYNHQFGFEASKKMVLYNPKNQNKETETFIKNYAQFHWFDIAIEGFDQMERIGIKQKCYKVFRKKINSQRVFNLKHYIVRNMSELNALFEKATKEYEGLMIKNPQGYYEHKRSSNIIKWKKVEDMEVEIVDILEGKGEREGMAGRYVIQFDYNGKIIRQDIDLKNVDKQFHIDALINKDKFIGSTITVEYFKQEKSGKLVLAKGDKNSLQFKAFRDDE